MNIDDALNTFIAESRELLEDMEEALLSIEQTPDDADTINAIFRAIHTIKGAAGLFDIEPIVAATHTAESVLVRVRDGELRVDSDLVALFLAVRDHVGGLIDLVAEKAVPDEAMREVGDRLEQRLVALLPSKAAAETQAVAFAAASRPAVEQIAHGDPAETELWHLSLRCGQDMLRNGMDPLSIFHYLGTLGTIVKIVTLTDGLPPAAEMDPEACYLGFEIGFSSDADKAAIEGAFDFVRDDATIRILPPHSKVSEYQRLIAELPEQEMRLGEILVKCGTLTATELETILGLQAADADKRARRIGEVLVEEQLVSAPVVEAALEKQRQIKSSKSGEGSSIRVDTEKLDQLINLVGELIIAGAGITLAAQRAGMPELAESASNMSRLVEEVRDSALTLRMVPIGATFNRFHRIVRDVGQELGKDIDLVVSGAETELDKTLVERISDPLLHLVRNAMDHGIESADNRVGRGKSPRGTIRLNAYHESGNIVIEVADDGRGLNRERIYDKAVRQGLIKPDQVLSEREINNLIFEPGFSTADKVSNISGRGVGMDVVRRNITDLRGTVDLDSEPGVGTTVIIRLPLTLAIIDGFLIGVGKAAYVVPQEMVVECIELSGETVADSRGRDFINLRGEVLPFIRLREMFGIDDERSRRENVVVVQCGGRRAGLVVDRLLGEFQTVIKPLGKVFSHIRGVGGFTILGSGEVALILDVSALIGQMTDRGQVAAMPIARE